MVDNNEEDVTNRPKNKNKSLNLGYDGKLRTTSNLTGFKSVIHGNFDRDSEKLYRK